MHFDGLGLCMPKPTSSEVVVLLFQHGQHQTLNHPPNIKPNFKPLKPNMFLLFPFKPTQNMFFMRQGHPQKTLWTRSPLAGRPAVSVPVSVSAPIPAPVPVPPVPAVAVAATLTVATSALAVSKLVLFHRQGILIRPYSKWVRTVVSGQ